MTSSIPGRFSVYTLFLCVVLSLCLSTPTLRAQCGWDLDFAGDGISANDSANALAVFDDGSGPALYVGGDFQTVDGIQTGRVARFDGSTWSAVATSSSSGRVNAMLVHDDGGGPELYVAGTVLMPGATASRGIARWDGSAWTAVGTGFDHSLFPEVFALTSYDDGSGNPLLIAGGKFDTAGGVAALNIAAWNGSSWAALGSGLPNNPIRGVAVFNCSLYAVGKDPIDLSTGPVFRWTGSSWSDLSGGPLPSGAANIPNFELTFLTVADAGDGSFLYTGGNSGSTIERYNGSTWDDPPGCEDPEIFNLVPPEPEDEKSLVNAVVSQVDALGRGLYIGGRFDFADSSTDPVFDANDIVRSDLAKCTSLDGGIDGFSDFDRVNALVVWNDLCGSSVYVAGDFRFQKQPLGSVAGLARWSCPMPRVTGPVVYVDKNATGDNNGTSWRDAFVELSYALRAIECTNRSGLGVAAQVWVAEGTYTPDDGRGRGRESTFRLIDDIEILGGFLGNERDVRERNPKSDRTILSGDLEGNDSCGGNTYDNAYHVVTADRVDASASLDGFKITGGEAEYFPDTSGAGMFVISATPTLRNLFFEKNHAVSQGGALYCEDSNLAALTNSRFLNNTASTGAAMYVESSIFTIENSTFDDNRAIGSAAALRIQSTSEITCERCVFTNNSITTGNGGAVTCLSSLATFSECEFTGNSAGGIGSGGAIYYGGGRGAVVTSVLSGNSAASGGAIFVRDCEGGAFPDAIVINSLLFDNNASFGGAIATISCDIAILNNTIIDNTATGNGGGVANSAIAPVSAPNFIDNIIYNNTDSGPEDQSAQVFGGNPNFLSNCIEGFTAAGTDGNINLDPMIDATGRLLPGSPCIDAGQSHIFLTATPEDIDGTPRILGTEVDIGAFEFFCPGDLNQNFECDVDTSGGPVTVMDDTGMFSVEYPNVTEPGDVSIESGVCDVDVPQGFTIPTGNTCYTVESTVGFNGLARVCLSYDDADVPDESMIEVLKCDNGNCVMLPIVALDIIGNIVCVETASFSSFAVIVPGGISFIRGDGNADGSLNIADASFIANFLFGIAPATAPPCEAGADANGDDRVNIADPTYVANFLFGIAPATPPPAPHPDCGFVESTLACDASPGCGG